MNCTILHLVCSWCRGTPTHFCGDERFCDECWARKYGVQSLYWHGLPPVGRMVVGDWPWEDVV